MYEMIKGFYEKGLWSIKRVKNAVVKNVIIAVQFKEITDEDYVA